VLGKPAGCFGFRDDREDLDSFARDVIEHPHFPNPEAILGLDRDIRQVVASVIGQQLQPL